MPSNLPFLILKVRNFDSVLTLLGVYVTAGAHELPKVAKER